MGVVTQNPVLRIALLTAVVLLIPFVAMQVTDGVDWDETDFIVVGVLTSSVGVAYELLTRTVGKKHRVAVGLVLAAAFLWIWVELAVGLFTDWGS